MEMKNAKNKKSVLMAIVAVVITCLMLLGINVTKSSFKFVGKTDSTEIAAGEFSAEVKAVDLSYHADPSAAVSSGQVLQLGKNTVGAPVNIPCPNLFADNIILDGTRYAQTVEVTNTGSLDQYIVFGSQVEPGDEQYCSEALMSRAQTETSYYDGEAWKLLQGSVKLEPGETMYFQTSVAFMPTPDVDGQQGADNAAIGGKAEIRSFLEINDR